MVLGWVGFLVAGLVSWGLVTLAGIPQPVSLAGIPVSLGRSPGLPRPVSLGRSPGLPQPVSWFPLAGIPSRSPGLLVTGRYP